MERKYYLNKFSKKDIPIVMMTEEEAELMLQNYEFSGSVIDKMESVNYEFSITDTEDFRYRKALMLAMLHPDKFIMVTDCNDNSMFLDEDLSEFGVIGIGKNSNLIETEGNSYLPSGLVLFITPEELTSLVDEKLFLQVNWEIFSGVYVKDSEQGNIFLAEEDTKVLDKSYMLKRCLEDNGFDSIQIYSKNQTQADIDNFKRGIIRTYTPGKRFSQVSRESQRWLKLQYQKRNRNTQNLDQSRIEFEIGNKLISILEIKEVIDFVDRLYIDLQDSSKKGVNHEFAIKCDLLEGLMRYKDYDYVIIPQAVYNDSRFGNIRMMMLFEVLAMFYFITGVKCLTEDNDVICNSWLKAIGKLNLAEWATFKDRYEILRKYDEAIDAGRPLVFLSEKDRTIWLSALTRRVKQNKVYLIKWNVLQESIKESEQIMLMGVEKTQNCIAFNSMITLNDRAIPVIEQNLDYLKDKELIGFNELDSKYSIFGSEKEWKVADLIESESPSGFVKYQYWDCVCRTVSQLVGMRISDLTGEPPFQEYVTLRDITFVRDNGEVYLVYGKLKEEYDILQITKDLSYMSRITTDDLNMIPLDAVDDVSEFLGDLKKSMERFKISGKPAAVTKTSYYTMVGDANVINRHVASGLYALCSDEYGYSSRYKFGVQSEQYATFSDYRCKNLSVFDFEMAYWYNHRMYKNLDEYAKIIPAYSQITGQSAVNLFGGLITLSDNKYRIEVYSPVAYKAGTVYLGLKALSEYGREDLEYEYENGYIV